MKNFSPLIFFFLFPFLLVSCTTTYTGRILRFGPTAYDSQDRFPSNTIRHSNHPFYFKEDASLQGVSAQKLNEINWSTAKGEQRTGSLSDMLELNETLGFIVIQDDVILYELYFEERDRATLFPAFSASKSITSALIGIAVDEGLLPGIDVPVQDYITGFNRKGYESITIRNLLEMNSGFRHTYGTSPNKDLVISAFHPKIEEMALRQKIIRTPGEIFEYNNYNTVLLGMILKNVTGLSPSAYLEEKIWRPIGAEYDARWNLSRDEGLEYMALGISASILDYAKFARLYLNGGEWNGCRIISSEWVEASVTTDPSVNGAPDYYNSRLGEVVNEYFAEKGVYYSRHWWGRRYPDDSVNFYAVGMFGQYLYVAPEKNMIIIRLGRSFGDVNWWPDVFKEVSERF